MEKLLRLNGVEYEMEQGAFPKNNFSPGRQIGLLAQNVEKIIPEAVSQNAMDTKALTMQGWCRLLIEAIKELKKKTKQQLRRIELLEKNDFFVVMCKNEVPKL